MWFLDQFTVTLDVTPIIFDANREVEALSQIRTIYARRCYQQTYIREIREIVRIGDTIINRMGDEPGMGTAEVIFRAECFRLFPGDPVAGMVVKVRSNIIVGSAAPRLPLPPLAITLNEPNDIFTVDKIIPVEVVSAIHSPMQGEISAIARPLACRRKETVWTVAEPARAGAGVDPEKLSELGKRLEEVLEARAALVESSDETEQGLARNLLLSCLNTYKTPAPLPAGFEPQEVAGAEGLKKLQSLLTPGTRWTRPLEKEYDWAGVCQVSLPPDAPLPPNYEAATAPAEAVLAMFQNAILGAVGVVNDMTRVFYTKEILTSHKAIFLLMRMKQLSPPQPPGGKA